MRIFYYESKTLCISHNTSNRSVPFIPHTHKSWELIFIKSGDLSYIIGNNIYQAGANTLLIARPSVIHSISFNTPEMYERYRIFFDESLFSKDLLAQIPQGLDVIDFNGNTLVNDLFQRMKLYSDAFEPEATKALLENTLQELLYHIANAARSWSKVKAQTNRPTIVKAIEYVNTHITEPLNIDAIATELFITRSHLHHLFVKHLNTTPKKYILNKKLLLAQRDLRLGYKPIEVCARCGFSDYSTFYRDYRLCFGYPPSKENKIPLDRDIEY